MGVVFSIVYHDAVVKEDIPNIAYVWRAKIKKAIETRLTTEPALFGKPLRRSLKGYRKLRVGDYRVVFRIEKYTVKIFVIAHRSFIYSLSPKRILL